MTYTLLILLALPLALQLSDEKSEPLAIGPFPEVVSARRGTVPTPKISGGTPPYQVQYYISGRRTHGGEVVNSPASAAMRQVIGATRSRSRGRIRERQKEFAEEFRKRAGRGPVGKVVDGFLVVEVADANLQRASASQLVYFEVSDEAFESVVSKWEADLEADNRKKAAGRIKQEAERASTLEAIRIRKETKARQARAKELRKQTRDMVRTAPTLDEILMGLVLICILGIFVPPLVFFAYRFAVSPIDWFLGGGDDENRTKFTALRMLGTSLLGSWVAIALFWPTFLCGRFIAFELFGFETPTSATSVGFFAIALECLVIAQIAVLLVGGQRGARFLICTAVMLTVFALFVGGYFLIVYYVFN